MKRERERDLGDSTSIIIRMYVSMLLSYCMSLLDCLRLKDDNNIYIDVRLDSSMYLWPLVM